MSFFKTALLLSLTYISLILAPAAQAQNHLATLASGGAGGWVNTKAPLSADDMKGRLILLDFWTYGCVNCMQIVPDLEQLEKMFGDRLLIIGVHSAKFKGEQGNDRILDAARRFGLKHPVMNDSNYAIWKQYRVNAWPTQILLSPAGTELGRYVGEGHLEKIKSDIARAIPTATNANAINPLLLSSQMQGTLAFPARLAIGPDNTLFIADSGHHRIVQITQDGKILHIIGAGSKGLKDGSYNNAQFNKPRGLVMLDDTLYVADTDNHALRKIDLARKTVSTIIGNGKKGEIASPWDLEVLDDGNSIAIAMAGRHQLWSLLARRGKISPLAGTGAEDITDGRSSAATLAQPSGLSYLPPSLFFVDAESSALRVLDNGNIKTLIGKGLFDFGNQDGDKMSAQMQHPQGLAATADHVYIADTYNDAIRVYDRTTGQLSTLPLPANSLREPGDILILGRKLWIADTNNHAIKIYDLDTTALTTLSLNP
ncbi:MAG TPA: thioredoxin-like domain-containing protein [Micavibrio sp.]